jgi:hypothetical protein
MIPKRVSDAVNLKWGFTVPYSSHLEPEHGQVVFLQSADEFLAFVRKQDKPVQDNGVWIVTTNPAAYSEMELTLLEDIKALCRKENIPLFICRGSELPNGWKRFDLTT